MRTVLISLAAAGTALAFAAPASAQYFPQPYGQPQGYGYGYNNYGQVRVLQARIDRVEHQINGLDRRDRIRDRSADRLRAEARGIEHHLHAAARYGLNPYEARDISQRIAGLEQRVQYALGRGYGRGYGYNGYNGYNTGGYYGQSAYGYDRDGDGRDDNEEHERWHERHDDDDD